MNPASSKVHSACFNAQQDGFSVATDSGIRFFNSHPPVLLRSFSREQVGGVKVVAILHRSNIIAFVGGGSYAKYPSNTVMIWDDKQQELVLEVTIAGGPILNVLLAYSKLVVLQERRIHVFQFPSPCKLIRTEEIRCNPTGLAAIGCDFNGSSQMLAYPGFKGTIHIFAVRDSDDAKRGILHKVGLSKGEKRSSVQISLEPRVLAVGFIKASSSSMQSVVAICQDGSYHRYFFAVKIIVQEQLAEAQELRNKFRDEVSKKMGELLLRGVTMLDAYCQICNGILMEDRNGVRTCVTCELFAERTREGSRLVAEVRMVDIERKNWAEGNVPVVGSKESTPSAPTTSVPARGPTGIRGVPLSFDGCTAALLAIDRKLKWAGERIDRSENPSEIREMFALVNEGLNIIRHAKVGRE
ncbi:Sjogren'S syndrome/scleroderma autoantigen 1 [Cooperia oncophora]